MSSTGKGEGTTRNTGRAQLLERAEHSDKKSDLTRSSQRVSKIEMRTGQYV